MKKILLGNSARIALKKGVDLVANSVKVSLGRNGNNVAIYNGTTTEVINDGVSIAKAIVVKDDVFMAGAQLAKQCAMQTDLDAGDGTTTTIVLLQAILDEIIQDFQTVPNRTLRSSLLDATGLVQLLLTPQKIKTKKEMYNLALTSSLNEGVAEMLSYGFHKLGKDAKVAIEETEGETEYQIISGLQFESRIATDKLLKNLTEENITLQSVHVLAMDRVESIEVVQQKLDATEANELVVIANYIDPGVLIAMVKAPVKFYPIENKGLSGFDDIIEYAKEKVKVVITRENTTLMGNAVSKSYIDAIQRGANTLYEKELISNRVAQLSSGILSIKVGGKTSVERNELLLKVEDASNALKKAMSHGFVKGRGLALYEASLKLSDEGAEGMIKRAIQTPFKIMYVEGEEVPESVIDSYITIKSALNNAVSTATSILMVESAIIEEKENED